MLTKIERISSANPAVRDFILHGISSIKRNIEFTVQNPEDNVLRGETIQKAQNAGIPIAAQLLRLPLFKRISCLSSNGVDCLSLELKKGKNWTDVIGNGKDSTLENVIQAQLEKKLKGVTRIAGNVFAAATPDEKETLIKFIDAHPLQKVVKKDNGTVKFGGLDKGNLTLLFGGNCGSKTTCAAKDQSTSHNWISSDLTRNFPGLVTHVQIVEQPKPAI